LLPNLSLSMPPIFHHISAKRSDLQNTPKWTPLGKLTTLHRPPSRLGGDTHPTGRRRFSRLRSASSAARFGWGVMHRSPQIFSSRTAPGHLEVFAVLTHASVIKKTKLQTQLLLRPARLPIHSAVTNAAPSDNISPIVQFSPYFSLFHRKQLFLI